jgi:uncharacterized membrane protein
MDRLLQVLTLFSALGAGLMAGLYFAFSGFIMTAFGRLPPANGMAAMNAINAAILNPLFFAVFFGTAATSLLLAIAALSDWQAPPSVWLIGGAVLYLVANIAVTMIFNVPLNDALGAAPGTPGAEVVWSRYLTVWTAWNHVRTVASLAAAACFTQALR